MALPPVLAAPPTADPTPVAPPPMMALVPSNERKYFHRVRRLIRNLEAPLAMPEMPAPMPTKVPLTPLTMLEPTLAMVWSRQPYSTQSGAGARTRGELANQRGAL